jgi:adenylate cyclase
MANTHRYIEGAAMDHSPEQAEYADRVDALSEKLASHFSPGIWRSLFYGADISSIRFDRRQQTVLYAEAPGSMVVDTRDRDNFTSELEWLAVRYDGRVEPFHRGAGVVFFDDPVACVRMAADLQRSAGALHLRMGLYTGPCEIATFCSECEVHTTLIGEETAKAAEVAATAATGSIAISPETYALVKDEIHSEASRCLVMEEFLESDLAQVCLTPAPAPGGEHALSTFAGLGR